MYKLQGMLFLILGRCYCLFLADVIAMVHDRCCCHGIMADVIALCFFCFIADVIAMYFKVHLHSMFSTYM